MDKTDPWFDSLYLRYAPKLVNVASLILDNWAVAEEIVQEVFLFLLLYEAEVREYDNPGVWLYKVLYNRIGNEFQKVSRHKEIPLSREHEELIGNGGEFGRLEDVLPMELSKKDRQILIWFYEENLSCKEIGKRIHRTTHTCEARLYRARKRCKELLLKK